MKQNLQQVLYQNMTAARHRAFITDNDQSINYANFLSDVLHLAAEIKIACPYCERIGIIGEKNIANITLFLAIIFSGKTAIPINPRASQVRQQTIIEEASITTVCCSDLEVLDASIYPHLLWSNQLLQNNTKPLTESDLSEYNINSDVYTMFTSGTTGRPKSITINTQNLLSCIDNLSIFYEQLKPFKASQTFDLSFDPAMADIFLTIKQQGELFLLDKKEQLVPIDFIRRNQLTIWNSVPSIAKFLYDLGQLKPNIFPSLRVSAFCGEPLPEYLAAAWAEAAPNSTVENLYGPTEATIYIARHVYQQQQPQEKFVNVPIGKIFANHRFMIVDDRRQPVPLGAKGELIISGKQICNGYKNHPSANTAFFTLPDNSNDIWYATGDIVASSDDGTMNCFGRVDNQIKIAGKRIELLEIEIELERIFDLRPIIVLPLEDANKRITSLSAFYQGSIENLKKKLEDEFQLDKHCIPHHFYPLEEIPLNTSGKIDRLKLKSILNAKVKQ